MTDETQDLEPIDLSSPPSGPGWPAGWYADPWTAGQYRYWTGQSWTGETNRWGPSSSVPGSGAATDPWPSAPVTATPMASGYGGNGTEEDDVASGYVAPRRRGPIIAGAIAVALLLLVSGVVGYAINSNSHSNNDASSAPGITLPPISVPGGASTPSTTPSTAPASTDPDRAVLGHLVVRQADVGPTQSVFLINNGNRTSQPTLDLCNGTFPSEKARTGRLQVAVVNPAGTTLLSTEAVLYRNPAATAQGFAELRKVRAACPNTPVVSPVHEDTATTTFKAAPDGAWPQTPTVDRQAYSFVTTTTSPPATSASIAVYLRRGRVLMGLYFVQPNTAPPTVAGQKTIEGIVGVFAQRLAQLPASVVNGP
jgi:hypothetical protein